MTPGKPLGKAVGGRCARKNDTGMRTLTGIMSQKSQIEYLESCRACYPRRNRAGKSGREVCVGLRRIEARMVIAMHGFDCDNGSEFLNTTVERHLLQKGRPPQCLWGQSPQWYVFFRLIEFFQ